MQAVSLALVTRGGHHVGAGGGVGAVGGVGGGGGGVGVGDEVGEGVGVEAPGLIKVPSFEVEKIVTQYHL